MFRFFLYSFFFLIVSSVSFSLESRFLLGVNTDATFGGKESTLSNSSMNNGAKIYNIQLSGAASSRELGIRFLSGFQFTRILDIYLGLGGSSSLTSQAIGENRVVYTQQNTFSFELSTKGNWYLYDNIGFYALLGGGLDYIYLTSGGGSKDIDFGLHWNDVGTYILTGLGSFLLVGEAKNHRFSIGVQGKFIFRNNKPYQLIDISDNTIKTLKIGKPGFLLGLHFEYVYLF